MGNTSRLRAPAETGKPAVMETRRASAVRSRALGLAALILCQAVGCASLRSVALDRDARRDLERGDVAEAVVKLETAARLTPDASPVWNDLGLAYTAVGRDLDALAAFARALELDCDNDAARENLAAARARAATALVDAPQPGGDAP